MLASILEIKSMDSASITLQTATVMKDRGMKDVSKVMECILSEMVTQGAVNGTVGP